MITLYTETMLRAELDAIGNAGGDLTDEDREIIMDEFDCYVEHCSILLSEELGGYDQVDVRDIDSGAGCCHTENQTESNAWNNLPGFWEWYN